MTDTKKIEQLLGEPVYTCREAAAEIGVVRQTMLTYLQTGKVKGQQIGGKWIVTETNLKRYITGE